MKLSKAVLKSLEEGGYDCLIKKVSFVPVKADAVVQAPVAPAPAPAPAPDALAPTTTGKRTKKAAPAPTPAPAPDALRQIEFEVVGHPGHTGRLIVWPKRAEFIYKHLANKANIAVLEDDEQLVGCTVELFFKHSYTDTVTGEIVFNEQWGLYA
jgi:hypothetical protein